jgi:hypothetical protein
MTIDKTTFQHNLHLTQAYCAQQLRRTEKNIASMLRSINPDCHGRPLFHFTLETCGPQQEPYFAANWAVDPYTDTTGFSFYDLFQQQLLVKQQAGEPNVEDMFDGEIIVSNFGISVTDGAPELASSGLFDVYDCAPVDTWFYEVDTPDGRVFLCWVPRPFVYAASQAIAVCCVDNINWFKDWAPEAYEQLMAIS